MVNSLILLLASWFTPDSLTPAVAVEASYVLATYQKPADKCCGLCKDGMVTHGDGHRTPCPCPDDCKCKTKGAVTHPPIQLHSCPGGKCQVKQTK